VLVFVVSTLTAVITVHMVGMYAPSILTGRLVGAFGWSRLALAGAGLYVVGRCTLNQVDP
jgi:hypothetical protein